MVAILPVVGAKLIWVSGWFGEMFDRLAVIAPAQRSAAFSRTTGDDHREARIVCAFPEHGLAEPRHAKDGDAPGVNALVGFQIIHRATQSPRPGGYRAPFVRSRLRLSGFEVERAHAVRKAALKVRVNLAVIDRGHADAGGQKWRDVQPPEVRSSGRRDSLLLSVPNLARLDSWVVNHARVRRKTQIQQQRNRLTSAGWQIDQQIHLRPRFVPREVDRHLFANSLPVQGGRAFIKNLEAHSRGTPRTAAELVLLEQSHDLRPPFP